MSPYNYFVKIIEDTAIDIQCWCKSDIEVNQTILDAQTDALEYLYKSIKDVDNKKIYNEMIEILVEYSIYIIDTYWGDVYKYKQHISFIQNYQHKFEIDKPILINYKERPFGKIPLDIQDNILKIKYNEDIKKYERYKFLLYNTNALLNYLEEKKKYSIIY